MRRVDWLHLLGAFVLLAAIPAAHERGEAGDARTLASERDAPPPDAAPKPLKTILLDTARAFDEDRTLAVAGGATFFGLLALFPAIASFVSVFGLVADSGRLSDLLTGLQDVLPGGAIEVIRDQIARIAGQGQRVLGWSLAVGLATTLWSANAGMKAMFDALNVAYGLRETRGFVRLNATSLLFTGAFLGAAVLSAIVLLALPSVFERLGLAGSAGLAVSLLRWPALFLALSLAIALLYRFGPTPQGQRWRWFTPGGVVAAVAWLVFSTAFSYYASHFGSYNATYGSLGAVIGMMTWIWLSITVILLGAEFNAQIERSAHARREDAKRAEAG